MKLTIKELRKTIKEANKIKASAAYLKKENIREKLQQLIASSVASGEIQDQGELEQYVQDMSMSVNTLKMIPYDVWLKISKS